MSIINLYPEDLSRFVDLFIQVNKNDSYYNTLAGDKSVEEYIRNVFTEQFKSIIKTGNTYGITNNTQLVGYVLGFDISTLKSFFPKLYDNVFDKASRIRGYVESLTAKTFFIVGFGCINDDKYQAQIELAIKKLIKDVGTDYTYVTDYNPNKDYVFTLLNNGFRPERLGQQIIYVRSHGKVW